MSVDGRSSTVLLPYASIAPIALIGAATLFPEAVGALRRG